MIQHYSSWLLQPDFNPTHVRLNGHKNYFNKSVESSAFSLHIYEDHIDQFPEKPKTLNLV